jgi:hypothetical protein
MMIQRGGRCDRLNSGDAEPVSSIYDRNPIRIPVQLIDGKWEYYDSRSL